MTEQPIVIQGNSFFQVHESDPLTEKERAIILAVVSMIHPSDEDERTTNDLRKNGMNCWRYRVLIANFS